VSFCKLIVKTIANIALCIFLVNFFCRVTFFPRINVGAELYINNGQTTMIATQSLAKKHTRLGELVLLELVTKKII